MPLWKLVESDCALLVSVPDYESQANNSMRSVTVHPEKSIRFTQHAASWCQLLNSVRKYKPTATFKEMAEAFGLSETSARRYYYGMHQVNGGYFGCGYNQVRRGAAVHIVTP